MKKRVFYFYLKNAMYLVEIISESHFRFGLGLMGEWIENYILRNSQFQTLMKLLRV